MGLGAHLLLDFREARLRVGQLNIQARNLSRVCVRERESVCERERESVCV